MKKLLILAVFIAKAISAGQFEAAAQQQAASSSVTNNPVNLISAETSQRSLLSKAIDAIAKGIFENKITLEDALAMMTYNSLSPELLAKAYFFLLPKDEDRVVDMSLLPKELAPYFKGVSVQDIIDHDMLPPLRRYSSFAPAGIVNFDLDLHGLYINDLTGISNVPHVTSLILDDNLITQIQPGVFNNLRNLRYLLLGDNQITDLHPHAFKGLLRLNTLLLYRNKISDIQPGAFSDLGHLTNLSLANNELTEIKPNTFVGLNKLEELKLQGNRLTAIRQGMFPEAHMLREIDLSLNSINSIDATAFTDFARLNKLDLRDTNVRDIPIDEQLRIIRAIKDIAPFAGIMY